MTFDVAYVVEYEARIHHPEGQPAEPGGEPGGAGPPGDAAPSSVVEDVLEKTPASNDERIAGDARGTEYRVSDRIEEETGDRVVRGRIPVTDKADAETIFGDVEPAIIGADEGEAIIVKSPAGAVTVAKVRKWYKNHPDERPVDESGNAYVPDQWDPSNHVVDETSG